MENLILYLLILIIPVISMVYIKSTYHKYRKIFNNKKISGFEVARNILDVNGLEDVHIVEVPGELSDHYDPRRKVVRLSTEIFHGETIAAAAVAAHEAGHAIQHSQGYKPLVIRNILFPFINITSYVAYIILVIAIIMQAVNLVWVSVGLMIFSLSFQIITLPIEFDATKRAKEQLRKNQLVSASEENGVSKMLNSAALTYVASLTASLLQVLRIILMFTSRDD